VSGRGKKVPGTASSLRGSKLAGIQVGIPIGASIAALLALAACGKTALEPAGEAASSRRAAPSAGEAPAATSAVPYPATPQAPPPVAPPAGQGSSVPLQRYITVDQFGYRPNMTKVAVLVDPVNGWNAGDSYSPEGTFEVRRWADGSVAFSGRVTLWNDGQVDENSGDRGSWFNFTRLEEPGLYYVYDPRNQVRSHPFEIAEEVYSKVLKTAARMFYFNRANFEKKKPYACLGDRCWPQGVDYMGSGQDGEARSIADLGNAPSAQSAEAETQLETNGKAHAHANAHAKSKTKAKGKARRDRKAKRAVTSARDLSGGWWDAGDTNKYVTFSNDAVHQLLTAFEEHPAAFTDDFGIPESGNGTPDLIDELLVELKWLVKMQPDDLEGGALLKVGNIEHGDPVPEESHFPRYYYPAPCSSSTIALAGELAHAAAVLRNLAGFQQYAFDLTQRAERAWTHYHGHPKSDACDDGTIKSGDADKSLKEQDQNAVTAAVYLLAVTGKPEYGEYVNEHYMETEPYESDSWSLYRQSQGDALLYYTHLEHANGATASAITARKRAQSEGIDLYRMRPQFDLYRAFMRTSSFHWGSNNQRAAVGNTNFDLVVHKIVKQPEDIKSVLDRAAGMLHSFHGVNPMQLVYLTNMYAVGGDACADEAYHHWFRDKHPRWDNARTSELGPAPGYVTGGPNKEFCKGQPAEEACSHSPVRDQPPAKAYVDTNTSNDPADPYARSWELTEPAIYYQASYLRLISKFVN
jgi:endoglucanase